MAAEIPEDLQRWMAKRRAALVMSILKGETSVQVAARKHGLTVSEIEEWEERVVVAMENALLSRPKDEHAIHHAMHRAVSCAARLLACVPSRFTVMLICVRTPP